MDDYCSKSFWKGNILNVNFKHPPKVDTVNVPVGGYVLIRLEASNPGYWLGHCHLFFHMVEGMVIIFKEGDPEKMFLKYINEKVKC